jgi:hypothetical protein
MVSRIIMAIATVFTPLLFIIVILSLTNEKFADWFWGCWF